MFKQIKKLTALLFVAATMFSFASCNKDDDNNGGDPSSNGASEISEASLLGEWGWPSNHEMKNKTIVINADHTGSGNMMNSLTWTLDGKKLVCLSGNGRGRLELTIKSINGDKMEVEGEWQMLDGNGNVVRVMNTATGTLIKTVTTQSPTLTESLMVGTWKFAETETPLCDEYNVIINSDHTFEYGYAHSIGTWRLEGSRFIGKENNYDHEYSFNVASMTSSATKVVLTAVDGKNGNMAFDGTFTKNL